MDEHGRYFKENLDTGKVLFFGQDGRRVTRPHDTAFR